ncbi:glycosyltransferase family 4 protein [Pseudomonadota bacterium]
MKIGIDCRMYSTNFTGIGRYVFELTQNLFKLDPKNQYVLFFNEPEYSIFQPPIEKVKKVLANAPYYSLAEQTKFLKTLNKEKLDLMHFTHFNAPIFYNRKSIITIHDLTLSFFPGKKKKSLIHRIGYNLTLNAGVKKAKKVIAVSNNTKKDLHEITHIPEEKIEVIYEGVNEDFKILSSEDDIKLMQEVKEKFALDKPFLLYTGVWRSHKNLQNLIRAFKILKEKHGFDGHLVITGRKDPLYQPDLLKVADELQVTKDIIFTDLVNEDELIALYNAAAAYVFPSLYEGFGLPPLEAMKCGTPVVTSNVSCIPEVCGDNAIFFDPHSPEDIAEKVYKVVSQPSLQEEMIKKGLKHVKQFSWTSMAEKTLELYNEALNS